MRDHIANDQSAHNRPTTTSMLLPWIERQCETGTATLFLLDEVFSTRNHQDLPAIFKAVEKIVKDTKSSIILVDHRLSLPCVIDLGNHLIAA